MEPENRPVAAAVAGAQAYPTLLLRLWVVRARLKARAGVRVVRPQATDEDRRLMALVAAAGVGLFMFLGCVAAGFTATTGALVIAVGFLAALCAGLDLLLKPDDDDCEAELAWVTGLLPEAKRVWDEWRAARRAARAARKVERAAQRHSAGADTAEDLVELALASGRPRQRG